MKPWEDISLVEYSEKEELVHTVTHALGLILSGCIFVYCLLPSIKSGDALRIICGFLYFFGTTVMFLTSVLYHAERNPKRKKLLRLLDHCMIFFAVAGTATGCVPAVCEIAGRLPGVLENRRLIRVK